MRNHRFEIRYSFSKLVDFKQKLKQILKNQKIILITWHQKCFKKKDIYNFILLKRYLHYWVGMKSYLYHAIFIISNTYGMIKLLFHFYCLSILSIKQNTKCYNLLQENYWNIGGN